jgi:putative drug exporter of the RND superfamily
MPRHTDATPPGGTARPPGGTARPPAVERIAGWSAGHRKTAVLGWLLMVVAAVMAGHVVGSKNLPVYDPGQSGQAERTLHQLIGTAASAPAEQVLIQSATGTFGTNQAMRQAVTDVAAALGTAPGSSAGIETPLTVNGGALVSADGHSVLVTFRVPGDPAKEDQTVQPAERAVAAVRPGPGVTIRITGDATIDRAVNAAITHDFAKAQSTSVPITLVLLVLVFGSLIAAGIPLLLAITSVVAAVSLLSVAAHWLPVAATTSEAVLLIGMAVGVDYSLFYLRREREERSRGASGAQALRIAAGTSGHAIVASGLTVMCSLAGLFLAGPVFTGIATGAIIVVAIAVIGSLTVLPALLSWLGPWVDRARVPFLGRGRAAARPSRLWAALARQVVRRPLVWGGLALLALVALAVPALGMRLGEPAFDTPENLPAATTMSAVQHAFPQTPSPAEVVVTGAGLHDAAFGSAVAALQGQAAASGTIHPPVVATSIAGGRGMTIMVPLAGPGSGPVSEHALAVLRDTILPHTLGGVGGITWAVTGATASQHDFTAALHSRTPLVLAMVAVLAFVLLAVVFRSVAIPLVSIGLNLLSVGAAYGLITLIFQAGRLTGPLGYVSFGAIIAWLPLFMFAFLFGISMDYHVFLLSRIREQRLRGSSAADAIVRGIASSAGVVTSAAVIMVAVFSIFATLSLIDLKILGVGMGAAVLIDATLIRGVLLPAALALLGDRAWPRAHTRHPEQLAQTLP